jgi:DNA helicase-2/ATP-dependent DNA helicase PcrA
MNTNLLEELNKEQREAVLYTEGPLLILAGAGSGKTRVITHRIAYLIKEKGVQPENILAITFTNKAAKEMKERVDALVGDISENIWISTFHSACVRILRRDIEKIGLNRSFIIFDSSDQKAVIKDCFKELNIDDKTYTPSAMLSAIGRGKDEMLEPEEYARTYEGDFRMSKTAEIYRLYQKKLKQNNALDFDDIIMYTVKLFQENPHVLAYYQRRFKYIHIDEYQDTNTAQYKLVSLLAHIHRNLCVVGDDDQSIYGFRGANIRNILDFEKEFKGAKVIKLEQNYRSTKTILDAANNVINNNMGRKQKVLWTDNNRGCKIYCNQSGNEHEEAFFVANQIRTIVKSGEKDYKDFAVLYRMNAQSRVLEEMLMREGIPYSIYGGLKFYDRKEIKDILAYLRLIQNPYDDYSLKRIINVPRRGIGNVTVERLESVANKEDCSMFEAITIAEKYTELQRVLSRLGEFRSLVMDLMNVKDKMPVSQLIGEVIEKSGILQELQNEKTTEAQSRIENIKELVSAALEFESKVESIDNYSDDSNDINSGDYGIWNEMENDTGLEAFLAHISLVADIDNLDEERNNVVLMTFHSAKGLEFPVVFMVGMEEQVFPGYRALYSKSELEEERRLCYVGMTRAEEKLYMTYTNSRTLFGKTSNNMASRFIEEIPDKLKEDYFSDNGESEYSEGYYGYGYNRYRGYNRYDKYDKSNEHINKTENIVSIYKVGEKVMHKKFGKGIITGVEKDDDDYKLEIVFNNVGIKRLMAAYANLEKIK